MAPQQPLLWVSVDSRGKVGSSARLTTNIKSHCAQYYHQASRHKMWNASGDLEVPEPHTTEAHNEEMTKRVHPIESLDHAACIHHISSPNLFSSESQATTPELDAGSEGRDKSGARRRKPQAWRTARCHRFRKQATTHDPETELFNISPEVLERLPAGMDSEVDELVRALHAAWLPSHSADEGSANDRSESKCDAMLSDPLALAVNMVSSFSRAAFSSPAPGSSPFASDEHPHLHHPLYLSKFSTIAIIRQRLSESSSINDPNIFQGIVTLAGCAFMAGNPSEGRLHLAACLEIARARGGLIALSHQELESQCLIDFGTAALSGELPIIPVDEMEAVVHARTPRARNSTSWADSGFATLQYLSTKQASQLREGFANLLDAAIENNQSTSRKPKPQEYRNSSLRGLLAGFQLCCNQQRFDNDLSKNAMEVGLYESLRLAGILLTAIACLKEIPKEHLLHHLTEEIMFHMQQLTAACLPRSAVSAMIWVCFLGAYGASTSAKQAFFLECISQLATLLHLEKWKNVREQIHHFPYLDRDFDDPFEELWNAAIFWSGSAEWF